MTTAKLTVFVAFTLAACAPSQTSPPIVEEPAPPTAEPSSPQPQPAEPTPQPTDLEPEPEPPPKPRGTLREAKRQAAELFGGIGMTEDEFSCTEQPNGSFRCEGSAMGRCSQVADCPGTPGGRCELGEPECIPLP